MPMIAALALAVSELLDPRLRRVFVRSLIAALAVLAALAFGAGALVHNAGWFDSWLLNRAVDLFGGLAILALCWLLFPTAVTIVLGFFIEDAIAAVEARRYPWLPPPRRQRLGEVIRSGLRIGVLGLALNLLALPLYLLLPGLNLIIFYGLNGWLLGREYFEMVALRRLDERQLRGVRAAHSLRLLGGGAVIAFLLTVPVVNLAAPLIAAIFMLHVFEGLRQQGRVALGSR